MFHTLLKRIFNALLVYFVTSCSKEETFKVEVYEYTDLKISITATETDQNKRPIVSLNNFACGSSVIKKTVGDTLISCRCNSGCDKVDRSPGPVLRTPLDRIDLYSNRYFGPNHPAGTSLNAFLYYTTDALPRPIEEWNARGFQYLPGLVLIDAPDTVKGLTLFVWNLRKRNGQMLVDSSWVILK